MNNFVIIEKKRVLTSGGKMKYRRIRDIREDNDEKQSEIAELLEITRPQYQLYESGKRELPMRLFIKLARHYNVTLDYLAGIIDIPLPLHSNSSGLTPKEAAILSAYKKNKTLQEAIDKLLDL